MSKIKGVTMALMLIFSVAGTLVLNGGNGNGPNSGSGGNAGNNGGGNNVWIYHQHGNGTWSLIEVPSGAVGGHAAHGDIWYQTGCPLTGPMNGCL